MTIEASLIIPLVFVIFITTLYFVFYLFNQCVLYQGSYLAALRGQQLKTASYDSQEAYIETQLDKLLDKQIYQYGIDYSVSAGLTGIKINSESKIENRLRSFGLYNKESFDSTATISMGQYFPIHNVWILHKFSK